MSGHRPTVPSGAQRSLFPQTAADSAARSADDVAENLPDAPLAVRMRPSSLDELLGQEAVCGPGTVLRRALEADHLPSLIFWGPPGTGKTSLARVIASATNSRFVALSAVSSGVADLRRVAQEAAAELEAGRRTVLFIDEIHRFSRSQQDVILPHVESGLIRLIGATTEHPGLTVNAALLSRSRVFPLAPLGEGALRQLVERALQDEERGLGATPSVLEPAAWQGLLQGAGGDARVALTVLELAVTATTPGSDGVRRIGAKDLAEAFQTPSLRYDRAGDEHYDQISAFIKSVRGSDPDAAIYWLARMLESGEDALFIARRMVILAAEDVGLADPHALALAVACQQAVQFIGLPEGYLPLAETALYLALAAKSNSALTAYQSAAQAVRATLNLPVPLHLRNAVTSLDRSLGHGQGYQYAHDAPEGVARQTYLPEALSNVTFYQPTERGAEKALALRLKEISLRLGRSALRSDPEHDKTPNKPMT